METTKRLTTSCGTLPWRLTDGKIFVLLIKQFANKDAWGIPKGHINEGETLQECAKRETFEETGLKVEIGARLPDVVAHFRDEEKTVVSFLAPCIDTTEPHRDDPDCEVAEARWFQADQLPKLQAYQSELITNAVKVLTG